MLTATLAAEAATVWRTWWLAAIAVAALCGVGAFMRHRRDVPTMTDPADPVRLDHTGLKTAAAVGLSLLALVIPATFGLKMAASKVNSAADPRSPETGQVEPGAWQGPTLRAKLTQTVADDRNDYTVYQVGCSPSGRTAQCVAKVAVRNRTDAPQTWYARMQRLYLGDGSWVEPAPAPTTSYNAGVDVFATPLAPQQTTLVQLVFVVPKTAKPQHLEIRTGVFRSGARIDLS